MEERSSGGASEGRGVRGWGGTQPGLWMSRAKEREALLKCWSFFLSSFLSILMGAPPSPSSSSISPSSSILLRGASGTHAPLANPPPPPLPPSLPLAPSACLPSLLPGRPGQCWRRSRDLQEICLSEKQLVRLSTANVCMLGPPPPPLPLGGTRARPGQHWRFHSLSPLFSFHLQAVILLSLPLR